MAEIQDSQINNSDLPAWQQKVHTEANTAINNAREFLKSLFSEPRIGITYAMLGAALYGTNAATGIRIYGSSGLSEQLQKSMSWVGNSLTNLFGAAGAAVGAATGSNAGNMSNVLTELAKAANAIADELKDPNVGGIPIHAEQEVCSQDVVVGKQLVIVNDENGGKDSVMDNAVPQLKTWSVTGYLTSNPYVTPLAGSLVIKPDLIAQRMLLQQYADSRMPVVFKTHDNLFYRVLITHMDTAYTAQANNALRINLQLTEFKSLVVDKTSMAVVIATPKG